MRQLKTFGLPGALALLAVTPFACGPDLDAPAGADVDTVASSGSSAVSVAPTLPPIPRAPAPPLTRLLAPAGSSVVTVYDLSPADGTANGDLLSIQHALDAFGIPYIVTRDLATALQTPEMLFVCDRFEDLPGAQANPIRDGLTTWIRAANHTLWISGIRDPAFLANQGLAPQAASNARGFLRLATGPALNAYADTAEEKEIWLATIDGPATFVQTRGFAPTGVAGWTVETLARFEDNIGGAVVATHAPTGGRVIHLGAKFSDLLLRMENERQDGHTRGASNVFEPSADTVRLWFKGAYERYTTTPFLRPAAPNGKRAAIILTHDIDASQAFAPLKNEFMPVEESYGVRSTLNVTTSYRNNGWINAFFDPLDNRAILKSAVARGFDVQSHGVSHLPDFQRFPVGPAAEIEDDYKPQYDEATKTTTGGGVLQELLISSMLLKKDIGVTVRGWRSGHLLRPKHLPAMLAATGYWYASNHDSGSVGGSFPFVALADYDTGGAESVVLEIPISNSDQNIETRTAAQNAALWIDVALKNSNNGAPTVILVHPPDPATKLPPYQAYLDRLATDPTLWVGTMDAWYTWYRAQGIRSQQN